jgi:hypothetical protein
MMGYEQLVRVVLLYRRSCAVVAVMHKAKEMTFPGPH